MNIRYARDNEIESIKEIWSYCFNDGPGFIDYYFKNKYSRGNTVVVDEEEEIVSSLQLNQYKVKLSDNVYDVSYVVGVSTFPQVRGRGYMKNIMEFTLDELYKKGQLISILMPIDYRLYRKYGYEHCYDQIEYNIDIEDLKRFKVSGKMKKVDEDYIDDLIEIHDSFLIDINGNTVRDRDYYKNLFSEIKSEDGHIYVHEDHGYEGYIIYFLNDDTMFVREMFYKNIDSLKAILKFIYNHNTQCKKVTISAPINDKLRFILDNPRNCEMKIKPFMMGRIINFKELMESINVDDDISLSFNIFIEDEFITENNGVFKIDINNKEIKVEKVQDEYELFFNINTMTQLAFSYIDVKEAMIINNMNIKNYENDAVKGLESIFSKKNNYINEYV